VRLPKGHVEAGESCEQTAIREVREEAGLKGVQILADLGQLTVEFDWNGRHTRRSECYFLMASSQAVLPEPPEPQFEVEWLPWDEALARLTYEAEKEWLLRARAAWATRAAGSTTPKQDRLE
jgi:8-oxo-dGTP pyrophosphatase MutT (NUDIX family)